MCVDPSSTPSERTNEEPQSKIWNGLCQETGLIDFLCVFVSPVHLSAAWSSTGKKEEKEGGGGGEGESTGDRKRGRRHWVHPPGPQSLHKLWGVPADALCLLRRLRFTEGEHLHCAVWSSACSSPWLQQHLAEEQVDSKRTSAQHQAAK